MCGLSVYLCDQFSLKLCNSHIQEWEKIRTHREPIIPTVVSPLGIEPNKPRALWDGRYVNEFCRDIPFSMDNATRVAEVSWENAYFFKLDHKNGYQHVPLHRDSWRFLGSFGKENIMFSQSCPLDGKTVLCFIIH